MTSTRPSQSSPRPAKPVLLFALHAIVLSLLLGNWPSARSLYPPFFRLQCDLLFDGGDGLTFRPAVSVGPQDTFVEARGGKGEAPRWRIGLSAVRMGYWPSAVLVAMLLATPMAPRRRLLAVLAGLVWLDAFAVGRVGLEILRAFAELEHGGAPDAAAGGALLLYRTASEVSNSNIVVIAAVLLAWVVTAQPRRNLALGALARLLGLQQPRPPTGGSRPSRPPG